MFFVLACMGVHACVYVSYVYPCGYVYPRMPDVTLYYSAALVLRKDLSLNLSFAIFDGLMTRKPQCPCVSVLLYGAGVCRCVRSQAHTCLFHNRPVCWLWVLGSDSGTHTCTASALTHGDVSLTLQHTNSFILQGCLQWFAAHAYGAVISEVISLTPLTPSRLHCKNLFTL